MSDEIRRRGLLAILVGQLQTLEYDALRVVSRVAARLELGRERYGDLDLAQPRPWRRERNEELLDAIVYEVAGELAAEDAAREAMHEQARAEMVGERPPPIPPEVLAARDRMLGVLGPTGLGIPADVLAAPVAEERRREALQLIGPVSVERDSGDEDDDPGPHTHIYVGTDQVDECEICGRIRGQSAKLELELEGPEYDFEGGAG